MDRQSIFLLGALEAGSDCLGVGLVSLEGDEQEYHEMFGWSSEVGDWVGTFHWPEQVWTLHVGPVWVEVVDTLVVVSKQQLELVSRVQLEVDGLEACKVWDQMAQICGEIFCFFW